jgi:hypothetical protein
MPSRSAIGSDSGVKNHPDASSTFRLIEKHQDPSSLLALIKVSVLIKDTCGMLDVFCEAREFGVTEGVCEFKESASVQLCQITGYWSSCSTRELEVDVAGLSNK